MFELSVALKYLIPRWRQLSVSIISMISILVIALVVWLILVFFSVTNGLENSWINKLISLTAPVRVTPTEKYYKSFYYLSDSISAQSDYTVKTIGEKLSSEEAISYNPDTDEEIPANWTAPDRDSQGNVKDLVKLAVAQMNDLSYNDYEMTVGSIHIKQMRGDMVNNLSQASYLGSFDTKNPSIATTALGISMEDLTNLYHMLAIAPENGNQDNPDDLFFATPGLVRQKLERFFNNVTVSALKTPKQGWVIPKDLLPQSGTFKVKALLRGDRIVRLIIPHNTKELSSTLTFDQGKAYASIDGGEQQLLGPETLILADGNLTMRAEWVPESLEYASHPDDISFRIALPLQNAKLSGVSHYGGLEIADAEIKTVFDSKPQHLPFWPYKIIWPDGTSEYSLPTSEAVLLPKTFKDAHVKLGDRGYLSYYSPTASAVQEQRVPVFVAGFYDPGIIPIGGKYVLANKEITTLFRISHNQEDTMLSNGINIRLNNLDQADAVKESLENAFQAVGIAPYWKVETYKEYEFTKDMIQQLHSEKNLFTLIATVIIIVACSNIISMLIILVNDKKLEIGILRSMGASSISIASIFGLCGVVMGVVGSLIGTIAAILTLKYLNVLIGWISWAQGYDMFSPVFYGDTLPNEMSVEALGFVFLATVLISLIAAIVPATKASLLRPSTILKAE